MMQYVCLIQTLKLCFETHTPEPKVFGNVFKIKLAASKILFPWLHKLFPWLHKVLFQNIRK